MNCVLRGGGGGGKRWHLDGRRTKKHNSISDYISCAEFLIEKGIVQQNKLAGWGYGAGGLLVAAAINSCPDLFRAAVLKVSMMVYFLLHDLIFPFLEIVCFCLLVCLDFGCIWIDPNNNYFE